MMEMNKYAVTLAWKDVDVEVEVKNTTIFKTANSKQKILHKVSGEAKSGELVAVIGCSGSGKTTLLETLSGTVPKEYFVSGTITVNGKNGKRMIRNNSSFLKQFKTLIPHMTVKEYLWYQFSLRVPNGNKDGASVNESVQNLLKEVGLVHVENTKISEMGVKKSLSGGEIRKLIFASEILGDPKFLFLDEPTTGLDSFAAKECVTILKKLVKIRNICAICTIHQPSSSVLRLLDKIILQTPIGKVAYDGKIPQALQFFEKRLDLKCPDEYNPCDFLLKHTSYNHQNEAVSKEKIEMICLEFQKEKLLYGSKPERNIEVELDDRAERRKCFTSNLNQIRLLTWREFLFISRSPKYLLKNCNRSLALAISMACIFWNQPMTSIGATNLVGATGELARHFGSQFTLNSGFVLYHLIVGFDEAVIVSDHEARLYSISSYMISKSIFDVVFCLFDTLILSSVAYWSIGLQRTFEKYAFFIAMMFLSNLAASAAGEFLRALCPRFRLFVDVGSAFINYQRNLTGYSIKFSSFPWYLSWTKYLFFVYYSTENIMVNQWRDIPSIKCEASESNSDMCFKNGKDVLKQYSYEEENLYRNIACMMALIIVTKCLVYSILLLKIKLK